LQLTRGEFEGPAVAFICRPFEPQIADYLLGEVSKVEYESSHTTEQNRPQTSKSLTAKLG